MSKELPIDSSAYYSIQFQGVLEQHWADQFGKLQVLNYQADKAASPPVTTVVGQVADQAALAGLLNVAYSLGLSLLSVSYLGRV